MACTVGWGVTIMEKLSGWPFLASYCCLELLGLGQVVGGVARVGHVVRLTRPERTGGRA